MLKKISIFWIILGALLFTSAIPLAVLSYRSIRTTSAEVEREQKQQLLNRVDAHASAINEQFRQFEITTNVSAARARELLLNPNIPLTDAQKADHLSHYQRDENNVLGLDTYYAAQFGTVPEPEALSVSNVFLNNTTELSPSIEHTILATEPLDNLWASIVEADFGTQWIYLTTNQGMMRLFPWHPNTYPIDWKPHTILFYMSASDQGIKILQPNTAGTPSIIQQISDPEPLAAFRDKADKGYPACPDSGQISTACYLDCSVYSNSLQSAYCRSSVWTAPYYDYAGQGLMVTNSLPIYSNNQVIAVMSHDLRIDVMEQQILSFQVGDEGFAFLLDREGRIVAHRDYSPEQFALDQPEGQPQFQLLAEEEPDIAPLISRMIEGARGVSSYTDRNGKEWIVAYTSVPAPEWHIGLAQPRAEIIAPATKIRFQVLTGAGVMVLAVLAMSVWLARRITRPVLQLSRTAKEIEKSVDTETTDLIGKNLESLSHLSSAREITNLASVFEQMVLALQHRMNELNSIYAMGQTITANVDYDATLKAVLDAVWSVVNYDGGEIALLKGSNLAVEAWRGDDGFNNTAGRKYKLGRGPTGTIAEKKESLLLSTVSDEHDMERTLGHNALGSEFIGRTNKVIINSFLGIPLQIGDRLIGTLTLVHRDKGHFTSDDERQLNKLAAQASVAIQNATQVREREQQLKRQIEELKVEIDQAKLTKQIEEVTDSDFFRQLQANAANMRRRFTGEDKPSEENDPDKPESGDAS